MDGITIDIKGIAETVEMLEYLKRSSITKALRRGENKGSTPMIKEARRRMPVRSGAAKRALTRKQKTYPNGSVITVLGEKRSAMEQYKGKTVRPAKYIAPLEKGHDGVAGREVFKGSFDATKSQAEQIIISTVIEVITADAIKRGYKP